MEHLVAQEITKVTAAYQKMQRHAKASGALTTKFPIGILVEWDNVRCKLNPEARLSYAQKLLLSGEKKE